MSDRAAEVSGLSAREIFDSLLQRERLGPTGVGDGIAIPHGKLAKCGRIFGIFARLERAIDFEALDGLPVDLIFLLIAPESPGADHFKALATIARVLRDPHGGPIAGDARRFGDLFAADVDADFACG